MLSIHYKVRKLVKRGLPFHLLLPVGPCGPWQTALVGLPSYETTWHRGSMRVASQVSVLLQLQAPQNANELRNM